MAKREFLQLCHTYKDKYNINGWFVSAKLDGMRALWDGGVSRGIACKDVPWANTAKDYIRIVEPVATGLWSRLGKPIFAPNWFLDELPNFPLDGELYLGPGRFQEVMSICRAYSGDWEGVRYMVFDSPPYESVFADGVIEVRLGNQKFTRELRGCVDWIKGKGYKTIVKGTSFERVYEWLGRNLTGGILIDQERLPFNTVASLRRLEEKLDEVLSLGDEGVIIRSHVAPWRAERSHSCLKYKPWLDAEGIVAGYTSGEGKLSGMMGAMWVEWRGRRFKISGFNYNDRMMVDEKFPIGSVVTFKYRELTNDGIPKEGRYWRKRIE